MKVSRIFDLLKLIGKNKIIITFLFYFLIIPDQISFSQNFEYTSRGNPPDRYEGLKPNPVSGLGIELLSAVINYQETEKRTIPSRYKLKFYLPETSAHITVRELIPTHFYWMDQVRQPWQKGLNIYEWPTKEVIAPLKLQKSKLGVVVHNIKYDGRDVEFISPVAFYHYKTPSKITAYRFAFKINCEANLSYTVFQRGNNTPMKKVELGKQTVGEPFSIIWDCLNMPENDYELVIEGYCVNNGINVLHSVLFHHQPDWHKIP